MCPVIADLGISKLIGQNAPTDYTKSTYEYLAPEQVDHKESSTVSDGFSLGCCFIEVLVVLSSGSKGYDELYDALVRDNRSCQFSRELRYVHQVLSTIAPKTKVRQLMRSVTSKMLEQNPLKRANTDQVASALSEISF